MEFKDKCVIVTGSARGIGREIALKFGAEGANVVVFDINIDGQAETAQAVCDEIKELLVRQVSSSVLFEESLKRMIADGVDTFIEIGPGKALSGFVKRIDKTKTILNIEDMAALEKTKEALSL